MKRKLKALIIIGIVILIIGSVFGIIKIAQHNEAKRKDEQERMENERIQMTYLELYNAFYVGTDETSFQALQIFGKYKPIESNSYGINCNVYLALKMYESRAGVILPYKIVIEYFSQEFEPDGSLRLYNSGLHPEIEAYVEYMQGRRDEMIAYVEQIDTLYGQYYFENKDKGFELQTFNELSSQMYDELAKKEDDPNYEMDLLSLQQQGY